MIKQIQHIFILFTVILIVGTACVGDEANDFIISNETFTLDISLQNISTRALTTEYGDNDGQFNENLINTLDVFFYQGATLKWHVNSLSYNAGTHKAVIPITIDKRSLFMNNSSITYDIYVIANNTANVSSIKEGDNNLDQLKNLVFETEEFVTNGGSAPQPSFVMDGKISKVVNLNNPDLGTVNLKRAAAKIRLRVVEVNVPGYTRDGTMQAQLVHFTNRSVLTDDGSAYVPQNDEWKQTNGKIVETKIGTSETLTTATPFYAYANDWSMQQSKETYIDLYVPLKDNNGVRNTYKYRIPITPRDLSGNNAQYAKKLQRNLLYDVGVSIRILGSREELPVEVTGNYTIKDWYSEEVLVDIKGAHYLVVSERNVVMPNSSTYTLTFNSSVPDVKLVSGSLKATSTFVNFSTGKQVTENVKSDQIPTVIVQANVASGTISINSKIPVNFIPKDIEFKITNGQLTETVSIRQLPATYFTSEKGEKSALRQDGNWKSNDPKQRNRYMYMINTLAPAGDIIWGFPPLDNSGNTDNSSEVSKMVSPRFMMASQLGATTTMNYNNAKKNCQDYWEETIINQVTVRYDDWRLPTEAELKLIDDLQHNSNNPQGVVMGGKHYWDAYSGNNAYLMSNPESSSSTGSSAHVRCIRDIKD